MVRAGAAKDAGTHGPRRRWAGIAGSGSDQSGMVAQRAALCRASGTRTRPAPASPMFPSAGGSKPERVMNPARLRDGPGTACGSDRGMSWMTS